MNKKAISPLIASVLLIGFTVALAVVVMTWGGGFIKKTTEQTGASAEKTLACANLNLDINVNCEGKTITLINNDDTNIMKVLIRKYDPKGDLAPGTNPLELKGIGGKSLITKYGTYKAVSVDLTGVSKLEIIPTLEGDVVCGDAPIEKIVNCPSVA